MERFVQLVTSGGVALVAGLWVTALTAPGSLPWLAGGALALAGATVLGAGIRIELDVEIRDA